MDMPTETNVWIGLDIGKADHFADVLDDEGSSLFAGGVANDEAAIAALLDRAASLGSPALVVDQAGSLAQLVITVAARRGVPVAYVPGLVMRRAADLYPGEAKTDRRDAFVLADFGRTRRRQLHWIDTGSDELLGQLRVLGGYDADLAADATRLSNRLRDALTSVSPALERVLGPRLHRAGVRDLLARYPSPAALAKAGRGRIGRTIRKRSPRLAAALTNAVVTALEAQTVAVPAEAVTGRVIAELAVELDRVRGRRDQLASEIAQLFEAHPFGRILGSLPGVGPRTGSTILAEIGDGSRFANGSRLASYAGLAPVTRQSGSSIRGQSRSRRHPELRGHIRDLVEADRTLAEHLRRHGRRGRRHPATAVPPRGRKPPHPRRGRVDAASRGTEYDIPHLRRGAGCAGLRGDARVRARRAVPARGAGSAQ